MNNAVTLNDEHPGVTQARMDVAVTDASISMDRSRAELRSLDELAKQLIHDAMSLELTGQSFSKDQAFYNNVAGDLRAAAEMLVKLEDGAAQAVVAHNKAVRVAAFDARRDCAGLAREVRDLVGDAPGERSEGWRAGADAVFNVILACQRLTA
jgi:hypothetical protein